MDKTEFSEFIDYEIGKKWRGVKSIFIPLFPELHAVYLYRKSQYHASNKGIFHKFKKKYYEVQLVRLYGIIASPNAIIGKGLKFIHPISIVIGSSVVAGENLHIYQNTTLGGARIGDVLEGNQPKLGDNVTIFSGAAVLGNIKLGDNVVVAANSTLLQDAPSNSICVGSPARIIVK